MAYPSGGRPVRTRGRGTSLCHLRHAPAGRRPRDRSGSRLRLKAGSGRRRDLSEGQPRSGVGAKSLGSARTRSSEWAEATSTLGMATTRLRDAIRLRWMKRAGGLPHARRNGATASACPKTWQCGCVAAADTDVRVGASAHGRAAAPTATHPHCRGSARSRRRSPLLLNLPFSRRSAATTDSPAMNMQRDPVCACDSRKRKPRIAGLYSCHTTARLRPRRLRPCTRPPGCRRRTRSCRRGRCPPAPPAAST